MILKNLRQEEQPKLMIIPMIDIIFFLLVFFMMNSLYMVQQPSIPVSLPFGSAGSVDSNKSIVVTIKAGGNVFVGNDGVQMQEVAPVVKEKQMGKTDTVVILKADKYAEHGKVIEVLDSLKLAGIRQVGMATDTAKR